MQKKNNKEEQKPIIVFNKSDKVVVSDVKKMTTEQILSNLGKVRAQESREELKKVGAVTAGGIVTGQFGGIAVRKIAVNNYRIKHPNSKLSDKEIADMLYQNN